ncbi:MAG: hypothetical protein Q8M11_00590 [Sulfuritalea sp.]|nr:hypothetical protein [Sulfuritalea sp.]MDP1984406.1 hypothetical protein [Sulfuritalea sp.]
MNQERFHLLRNYPIEKSRNSSRDVIVVALQHLLPSITHLFSRLIDLGFQPGNIWVLGKPYSTVKRTALELRDTYGIHVFRAGEQRLFPPGGYASEARLEAEEFWRTVNEKIGRERRKVIVLDEGGMLRKTMPNQFLSAGHELVAIEHTSSGWDPNDANLLKYPVILKARSFAKLKFESPFIARALMARLVNELGTSRDYQEDAIDDDVSCDDEEIGRVMSEHSIGIIGFGNLGASIARYLHGIGVTKLSAVDSVSSAFNQPEAHFVRRCNRGELVSNCGVLLGCTGVMVDQVDVALFKREYINARHKRMPVAPQIALPAKYFASCSSGDREFSRLIPHMLQIDRKYRENGYANATGQVGQANVTLLNGGFPLNFDRQVEYEPFDRILLTRELTLASIMQANWMLHGQLLNPQPIKLDAAMQMEVVTNWVRMIAEDEDIDVNTVSHPENCKRLGIPFEPPSTMSVWTAKSEGVELGSPFGT